MLKLWILGRGRLLSNGALHRIAHSTRAESNSIRARVPFEKKIEAWARSARFHLCIQILSDGFYFCLRAIKNLIRLIKYAELSFKKLMILFIGNLFFKRFAPPIWHFHFFKLKYMTSTKINRISNLSLESISNVMTTIIMILISNWKCELLDSGWQRVVSFRLLEEMCLQRASMSCFTLKFLKWYLISTEYNILSVIYLCWMEKYRGRNNYSSQLSLVLSQKSDRLRFSLMLFP